MEQKRKYRCYELTAFMKDADASEVVQAFLDWLTDMEDMQKKAWETVVTEGDRVTDFLHEFEFEANSKKRAVIATKLHDSRCRRRQCKDTVKLLKPVATFVKESTSRSMIKMMKRMQSELKSAEDYVYGDRVYKPRVQEREDKGVSDGA